MGQRTTLTISNESSAQTPAERMRGTDRAPALRISHVVRGRERIGSRLTYLVDPDGLGHERGVSETVVLKRWRQRKMAGHVFSGARLSPSVWRAMAIAFPALSQTSLVPEVADISVQLERQVDALRSKHLYLPSPQVIRVLALDLGPQRLGALMDHHTNVLGPGLSGVPDLYLYAQKVDQVHGKPAFSRFVEVKRPNEQVSAAQLQHIDHLRSLGLQARVLRLIERG